MAIKDSCFPTFEGTCGSYGGRTYPSLGIKKDDSITEAIEKLGAALSNEDPASPEETVDISVISGVASPCAPKIVSTEFQYGVSVLDSKVLFSYDLTNTTKSLSKDLSILKTEIEILTANSSYSLLKGTVGGAAFTATSFPLIVSFKIDVSGDCGFVKLRKEVSIPLASTRAETQFSIQDFGDVNYQNPINSSEAVRILAETIKTIDLKFNQKILQLEEENRALRFLIDSKT